MNTAEYLVKKLEELGINDFFGLPGDYNFNILYAIENNSNTRWIGCTNELNAAYAADGYARQRGYGALVTTYGVGELSAINGIAGSFAENIPVIHIVGTPSSSCINNKTRVHHNFQDVQPFAYKNAFEQVVETSAFLSRDNAKLEIDRVLKTFVKEKKPVYIAIPLDIATQEISERDISYDWTSEEETLNKVTKNILEKIQKSKSPVILGDILVKRFDANIEYKEFVEKSGIPTTNFLMGTNLIKNNTPNYLGTYFSKFKNETAKKYLENTDCLIAVGPIYSDLNAFGFNLPYKINSHIAIYGTHTYVDGIKYENIKMADVLNSLSKSIITQEHKIEKESLVYDKVTASAEKLTSEYIYPRLQEFLRENDILFAETGIIPQGVAQIEFPDRAELNTQTLWSSIGWATPAAFGACIANPKKRVILFTGEGAHQLTAMELGNMLRFGVKPVIIVLNNNGYTIERVLCNSEDDTFNDIVKINYSKFARIFEGDIWSTRVETEEDFDKALKVSQIINKLCYIEACTDKMDAPELTKKIIEEFKAVAKCEKPQENEIVNKIREENIKINSTSVVNFNTKIHESLRKD